MATIFNKMDKIEENKFGNIKEAFESFSTATKPQSLDDDMNQAVPIWMVLGLTEEEYKAKYQPDSPAVAAVESSVVDVEEKDVFSNKMNRLKNPVSKFR